MSVKQRVQIIGGGLAGSEVAWALTKQGVEVDLYEMRPVQNTPAHTSDRLAELVCSNSFRSQSTHKAVGILKREMSLMGSLVMEAAKQSQVPAGDALAVDRNIFSEIITQKMENHPLIKIHREEVQDLQEVLTQGPVVVASGPLTSAALSKALQPLIGAEQLYFYDAISPIVDGATIDFEKVFSASRYEKGEGEDYLNCPMDKEQYYHFVRQLRNGQRVLLKPFEKEIYFEGCLPIEVMADRGDLTLAFGPMKPVGLRNPKTSEQHFAVVQLRKEDHDGIAFNIVGFQTKLTHPEQQRIFRLIPGLEKAEFFRLGSIHRNTYIHSPKVLNRSFQLKKDPRIRFVGQITGTEGYVESAALGVLLGHMMAWEIKDKSLSLPPPTTAMGALAHYLTGLPPKDYQPMNVNFGIFSSLSPKDLTKGRRGPRGFRKEARNEAYDTRAEGDFQEWLAGHGLLTESALLNPLLQPKPVSNITV